MNLPSIQRDLVLVRIDLGYVQWFVIFVGISRDHWHKRRKTGGKRKPIRKKRKHELGRPAANTKVGYLFFFFL